MLARISSKLFSFSHDQLPSIYFSLILFGQVFLSLFINVFNIDNRMSMLAFRFLIMALSFGFIFLNFTRKKLSLFSNPWVYSVLIFWLLYIARLIFDVHVSNFKLALPAWELLAWSLGSSLPIAICTYLYAAQNTMNFILFKAFRYGVSMLGISVILFLFNPGIEQGAFYLEHLNPITCANAGCALFLLGFSRILIKNIGSVDFNASRLITSLGITIGLFIALFSATRGVILAVSLIVMGSIFCLRSYLRFSFFRRWKSIALIMAAFCLIILSASLSTRLLEKLFTTHAPVTIMIRLELWRLSILEFMSNPLLGAGFRMHEVLGGVQLASGLHYPHNYLFESLATGGIILTFPLVYCILSPALNFHRKYTSELAILPICLLSIQVFIYSMHNGHLGDSPFFWMMIGIMAGTKRRLENKASSDFN